MAVLTGKKKQKILKECEGAIERVPENDHDSPPIVSYNSCRQYLLENFNLDEQSAGNVLDAFIRSLKDSIKQFDKALQAADRENIRAFSHKMKGGLFNINCAHLSQLAREIESNAHTKELTEIDNLANKIKKGLEPLLQGEKQQ